MKKILILAGVIVLAGIGLLAWQLGHREDHFGKPFAGFPPAAISDLVANPAAFLGKSVTIHGRLKRQCPATGCWFFLTDPADPKAQELKIETGDTTPRLPKRLGWFAQVEGQLIKFGDGYQFIGIAVTFRKEHQP